MTVIQDADRLEPLGDLSPDAAGAIVIQGVFALAEGKLQLELEIVPPAQVHTHPKTLQHTNVAGVRGKWVVVQAGLAEVMEGAELKDAT